MPEIIADGSPFQIPEAAANEFYATQTNPGLGSFVASTLGEGPTAFLGRAAERGAQAGSSWFDRALNQYGASEAGAELPEPEQTPTLPPEDYNRLYAPVGPDGKQVSIGDQPMPEGLARTIGQQKSDAIEREGVLSRFANTHAGVTTFGAGAAASMLDPLNAATAFIPGVGEEAIAAQLGGGILARTAGRVVAGAGIGAAAQVPASALRMGLAPEEASDYGMRDALRDVLYSAAGVAALHTGLGSVGELLGRGDAATGQNAQPIIPGNIPATEQAAPTLAEATTAPSDIRQQYIDHLSTANPDQRSAFEAMSLDELRDRVAPPSWQLARQSLTIDAATQNAAMRSAVGEMAEGRPVDVAPVVASAQPAANAAPEVIGRAQFIGPFTDAHGATDLVAAADALTSRVDAALGDGRPVTLFADGKPVPIVAVERGMMQDAAGQRWGTMALATDHNGSNRVEIGPAPGAGEAPGTLRDAASDQAAQQSQGWAPGLSPDELAAANDAVYGRRAEETPKPVAATSAEGATTIDADLAAAEDRFAQTNPETLHAEDQAELARTAEQVEQTSAPTFKEALKQAASCLIGIA